MIIIEGLIQAVMENSPSIGRLLLGLLTIMLLIASSYSVKDGQGAWLIIFIFGVYAGKILNTFGEC